MLKKLSFSVLAPLTGLLFFATSLPAQDHIVHEPEEYSEEVDEAHLDESTEDDAFDPSVMIMHHIQDSHEFHVWGEGESSVTVPLPIILWTENGLVTFMSSAFHHDMHGHEVVERKGLNFVNYHDDIHIVGEDGKLHFDEEGHPTSPTPLDLSITKNVFTLLFSSFLLCLIFMSVARSYKKNKGAPKGLTSFMEPLVVFVRDDIAKPNIGHKYEKFVPFLLTIFFLIWINNLIGLIPFFPFSANLSGNIAFTMTLAVFALIVVNFSGNANYWKHIFLPKPWWLMPILVPIEFLSNVVTKFFALMIRLFANITAGHIIILSLISLIFFFKNVAMAGVSVPFALFISVLELLVAALQAYIFAMLTALFIGQAVAEDHH